MLWYLISATLIVIGLGSLAVAYFEKRQRKNDAYNDKIIRLNRNIEEFDNFVKRSKES